MLRSAWLTSPTVLLRSTSAIRESARHNSSKTFKMTPEETVGKFVTSKIFSGFWSLLRCKIFIMRFQVVQTLTGAWRCLLERTKKNFSPTIS